MRPAGDDHDAIAQRGDLLHDVRRQHHAAAFHLQLQQEFPQRPGGHDVEPVGGFVEQDGAGLVDQRPRDRDLDPLALREAVGAPVDELAHVEHAGQLVDAAGDEILVQPLQLAVVADVLARGEPVVQAARIRHHAQLALDPMGSASGSMPSTVMLPLSGLSSV